MRGDAVVLVSAADIDTTCEPARSLRGPAAAEASILTPMCAWKGSMQLKTLQLQDICLQHVSGPLALLDRLPSGGQALRLDKRIRLEDTAMRHLTARPGACLLYGQLSPAAASSKLAKLLREQAMGAAQVCQDGVSINVLPSIASTSALHPVTTAPAIIVLIVPP